MEPGSNLQVYCTPVVADTFRFLTAITIVLSQTVDMSRRLDSSPTHTEFQARARWDAHKVNVVVSEASSVVLSSKHEDVPNVKDVLMPIKIGVWEALVAPAVLFVANVTGLKFLDRM